MNGRDYPIGLFWWSDAVKLSEIMGELHDLKAEVGRLRTENESLIRVNYGLMTAGKPPPIESFPEGGD